MNLAIAFIALAFSGCATITLDVPTKGGRATLTTDGHSVLFGLSK
jgi:uncharacterized protein YceK